MNFAEIIKAILVVTLPFIQELVQSKVVPFLKRKAYETSQTNENQRRG